jgi:transcriptional regulator with XRE-family HTH domain
MTMTSQVDIQTRHLLITQRLRQRRDDLGLTQKEVVTRLGKCGLRTTNRALSSLEHGTGLDVAKLPELAAALDCTVTYLVGLTDDAHSWEPDESVVVPVRGAPLALPARTSAPSSSTAPMVGTVEDPDETSRPASLILGVGIPSRTIRRT